MLRCGTLPVAAAEAATTSGGLPWPKARNLLLLDHSTTYCLRRQEARAPPQEASGRGLARSLPQSWRTDGSGLDLATQAGQASRRAKQQSLGGRR